MAKKKSKFLSFSSHMLSVGSATVIGLGVLFFLALHLSQQDKIKNAQLEISKPAERVFKQDVKKPLTMDSLVHKVAAAQDGKQVAPQSNTGDQAQVKTKTETKIEAEDKTEHKTKANTEATAPADPKPEAKTKEQTDQKSEASTKNKNKNKDKDKDKDLKTKALAEDPTMKPAQPAKVNISHQLKKISAKQLFGYVLNAARMRAGAVGSYARGCLSGAKALPVDGPAWQAMRLSRNRNWGHPKLIKYVERLAVTAKDKKIWNGLMVGDLSQPRGGPMLTGHASHQVGLDADIWLRPMPTKRLTYKERETISAISMLDKTKLSVNKKIWTNNHYKLVRLAASYPEVARIFVHPAIKKAICEMSEGERDRVNWLKKVRPWYGHHYHFHVRLKCQGGALCKGQSEVRTDDGCGKELKNWYKILTRKRKPKPKPKPKPTTVVKKKPRVVKTLAWLPKQCSNVLLLNNSEILASLKMDENIPLPVRKSQANY